MFRWPLFVIIFYTFLVSDIIEAQQRNGSNQVNGRGRSNRGYYGDKAYERMQANAVKDKKSMKPSIKQSSLGHGLSAWAIVGIVLTVILGAMGAYYVALFYPIMCKKERKYDAYDAIELNAV